ncbi:PKD domain-containing protein [Bathymodiolus platifrons methanotrophic gill symbiont]|uniref:PKD domain-containing protein n=1 Tax=Bathymodiolus platifrons methanotrophic gill symbiont TaxID=113268 RepID=UPI001C8DE682|nr:PKD domain-containing protein [Bathymodiolus platifrons methanotrophic gill symbiont]
MIIRTVFKIYGLLFLTLTTGLVFANSFTVDERTLVSSTLISSDIAELVYSVKITNNGNRVSFVNAIITSTDSNIVIRDGNLTFGAIAANAQGTSKDTFTLRKKSYIPVNSDALVFTFSSTPNTDKPISNAGSDQTVKLNSLVTLNGINSSDADGDPLTFKWEMVDIPMGSTAELTDSDQSTPFFTSDSPGRYVVQLIVNDSQLASLPDQVVISNENSAPVAEAGSSQSVQVSNTVMLDGSASSDVDGDSLTFAWSFISKPNNSTATISGSSVIKPEFIVDEPGTYELQLIVNDGQINSQPDIVTITTENSAPIAKAGDDFSTLVNQVVSLDGTTSSDVDGNPLTYKWSISSRPAGSTSTLSDSAVPKPTLLIDYPGIYGVQLIVNDSTVDSTPDTVAITTENTKPIASAGDDQTIAVADQVQLDGSNSNDVNLDVLSYRWSFSSKPAESKATLQNPLNEKPTFIIDYPGTYVVQLIVNDSTVDSLADTVVISTQKSRPVANAGLDQSAFIGSKINIDGELSFDVDSDPLSYQWSLIYKPVGSLSELAATNTVASEFTPDLPGTYILQLIILDGTLSSEPDTVLVEVKVLEATIKSSINTGVVPLDVTLNAIPIGGYPPYQFQWDLDGNNTIDDLRQNFVHTFLQRGNYNLSLKIKDHKGYEAIATKLISVNSEPLVIAAASPNSGPVPLPVIFTATVSDADGSITKYDWDFDGDGVVDQSSETTENASHTYQQAGLYNAKLTVYDNDGHSNSDTTTISVGSSPEVVASADIFTGIAPLSVNFSGTATDSDGRIVSYEWDFDGDKQFDYDNSLSATTTHIYEEGGVFNATLRVVDDDGLLDEDSVSISVSGSPTSLPGAYPLSGSTPLTVTFFSNGKDLDGGPEYYDWDFDGNGSFDQRLMASQNTTFTYNQPGEYQATLKVVDNDGLFSTSSITIKVNEGAGGDEYPVVQAYASPTVGSTPLETHLSAIASDDGRIVKYEWDLDSDGVYDFIEQATGINLISETIDVGSKATPAFVDLDDDGDLDMLIGNSSGQITYFQNEGSSSVFKFSNKGLIEDVAGNIIDIGSFSTPYAHDIDGDNDIDLLVGNYSGYTNIIENTGTKENPTWKNNGTLKLENGSNLAVDSLAKPIVYSLGNDTDWDLLIGDKSGWISIFENTGSNSVPVWVDKGNIQDSSALRIDVGGSAAPQLIDHDGDGDLDLYVGERRGRIVYIENQGTDQTPSWVNQSYLTDNLGSTLDIGLYAAPVIASTSGATLNDLWIGNSLGQISWYQQVSTNPLSWQSKGNSYNSSGVGNYASPTRIDYNNNGVLDLVVGNSIGQLRLIKNIGTNEQAYFRMDSLLINEQGDAIDIGYYATPAFYDLDNDDDDDLVVGNNNGEFVHYKNIGTAELPNWTSLGLLKNANGSIIGVGRYAAPFFIDYDADGDIDILSGNFDGQLYFIENMGTVSNPIWKNSVRIVDENNNIIDVGAYAKPIVSDLNFNGISELLIGNSYGRIFRYKNVSNTTGYSWSLKSTQLGKVDVGGFAAPLAMNLDGDIDDDLLIGNGSGLIYQLKSVGNVEKIFTTEGDHTSTIRVTDNTGKNATDSITLNVLPTGSPTLELSSSVEDGLVPLNVAFVATATDLDGTIASYEWDFDGDGVYEKTGSARETFTYNSVGEFNPRVRVTDNNGKQAIDSVIVKVNMQVNLSHNAVINPSQGEKSAISTILNADVTITLKIVDELGNVIKTLVDGEFRDAGTYVDSWDGYDSLNNQVGDGSYYYVLSYSNNGVEGEIDLRESATFSQYTPSRTWPGKFNPYTGVPVTSTYTVNKPSEVSFYFWVRDNSRPGSNIAPVRTLFIRKLKAAGTHTEIWDGVDDNGVPVKPGEQYRITLWVYELPDNAIVITGDKPEVSNLTVTNRTFNPKFNPYSTEPDQTESARVAFDISKDALMNVVAIDSTGLKIDLFTKAGLTAGANSISWDGRNFKGELVLPGVYSLQLTAIDSKGNRSLPRYAILTVRY